MKRLVIRSIAMTLAWVTLNFSWPVGAHQSAPPDGGVPNRPALIAVNPAALTNHVRALAAPVMEGRRAGSAGDKLAGAYIAEQFRRAGLLPAGDNNTFFQSFSFESWRAMPITGLSLIESGRVRKSYTCEWFDRRTGQDFRPVPRSASGNVTAGVVCIGAGHADDVVGVDLKGKVALILVGTEPTGDSPIVVAAKRGARACLVANSPGVGETTSAPDRILTAEEAATGIPVLSIRDSVRDEFLGAWTARPDAARAVFDSGATVQIDLRVEHIPTAQTFNVVGILPGSDPQLQDEPVLVATYRDGLGADAEGRPCLGATDNAAAIAVLLETARVLAQFRPARSVVFIAYGAEATALPDGPSSPGLSYYKEHPTVGIDRIGAVFRFDRIGPAAPERITMDNVAVFPDLFLKIRSKLPELNGTLIAGGVTPSDGIWPEGVPVYRLHDEGRNTNTASRSVLYPTEDTPERLQVEAPLTYTNVLARVVALAATDGPAVQRRHLEAMYRATAINFTALSKADFYRQAAVVRRDFVTDVVTYVPGADDREGGVRALREEFGEILENLVDPRSRLRLVRGPADISVSTAVGGSALAADNRIGVWLGVNAGDVPVGLAAGALADYKAAGAHFVLVDERGARAVAADGGGEILRAARAAGLWVLLDEPDAKRRRKCLAAADDSVLIIDRRLSDAEIRAAVEAGHSIVVPPIGEDRKKSDGLETAVTGYVERVRHLVELVGPDHIVLNALPPEFAVEVTLRLAQSGFSPRMIQDLWGENFARFFGALGNPVAVRAVTGGKSPRAETVSGPGQ